MQHTWKEVKKYGNVSVPVRGVSCNSGTIRARIYWDNVSVPVRGVSCNKEKPKMTPIVKGFPSP